MRKFHKNFRFFEVYSAATPPLPTILHQVAVPTCTTSLQKMKTIGPLVIELVSLEIRGSSQLPPTVYYSNNTLKGTEIDRNPGIDSSSELRRSWKELWCFLDVQPMLQADCERFGNRNAPPELTILVFVKIPVSSSSI